MFVVGMDIGYSNLKLASGEAGGLMQMQVYPVGAAPEDRFAGNIMGGNGSGYRVQVDGQPYVACVEPDKLPNWQRALHEEYAMTPTYKALFHAGILATGQLTIDHLVTGLPVSHYLEEHRREGLARRLKGTHHVQEGVSVQVRDVTVIPQPVGCYLDVAWATGREEEMADAEVLVVDPGFFSVDWVLISGNDVQYPWSGTSTQATSMLLEEAARLMGEQYQARIPVEKIERAIRSGKPSIRIFDTRRDYAPFIEQAAKVIGRSVMDKVKTSLRGKAGEVDVVILAGGGASYYSEAVREIFPRAEMILPDNSVLTNARGFWYYGLPG